MPPRSTKDTPIEEHCKKYGLNPSFDLPTSKSNFKTNPKWNDKKIQTLMLPDALNRYIDSIYKKYNSSIKETGVNPLFFCFGFLEWKESLNSNDKLYSPIMTFQIAFNKKNNKRNFFVNGIGNELSLNQALNEKLKRDFSLELPELKEREDDRNGCLIYTYLEEVKKKIAINHNWKVRNWISFGLYSTQNMVISTDLRNLAEGDIEEGPLEKILLGKSSGSRSIEEYDIDDIKHVKEVPAIIESADASQYSAMLDVLKGKNTVIKGPPGTGKSQTIVNTIANLILKGKKVLFVAQKQAALDIVKNKLQANGLGEYILEVFSAKANKKNIMESIKSRLSLKSSYEASQTLDTKIRNFCDIKRNLNNYARFMSKKFNNTNFTIHDIIWRYEPSRELRFFKVKNPESISKETIQNHIRDLNKIKNVCQKNNLQSLKGNPFYRIKNLPFDYDEFFSIKDKIDIFHQKINCLLKNEEEILKLNPSLNENFFDHPLAREWFKIEDKEKEGYFKLLKIIFRANTESLKNYINKKIEYQNIKKENRSYREQMKYFILYNPPDLDSIKEAERILKQANISSIFSLKYWKAKKLFKKVYFGKENLTPGILLENLYKYLKNEPINKQKQADAKKSVDQLLEKIKIQTQTKNPDSILFKEGEDYSNMLLLMIDHSKTLNVELKKAWLKEPDSLMLYKELIQKQKELANKCKQELFNSLCIEISFENDKSGFKDLVEFFEEIQNNSLNLEKVQRDSRYYQCYG